MATMATMAVVLTSHLRSPSPPEREQIYDSDNLIEMEFAGEAPLTTFSGGPSGWMLNAKLLRQAEEEEARAGSGAGIFPVFSGDPRTRYTSDSVNHFNYAMEHSLFDPLATGALNRAEDIQVVRA